MSKLTRKRTVYEYITRGTEFVTFVAPEEDFLRTIHLSLADWKDFGHPHFLTVHIEAGDLLNG